MFGFVVSCIEIVNTGSLPRFARFVQRYQPRYAIIITIIHHQ